MGRKKKQVENKEIVKDNDEYITITVDNNFGNDIFDEANKEEIKQNDSDYFEIPTIKSQLSVSANENVEEKREDEPKRISRMTDGKGSRKKKKGKRTPEEKRQYKEYKKLKNWKKWSKKRKFFVGLLFFFLALILLGCVVFSTYIFKADGNIKEAVLNVATDIVGEQDPIFVLVLGVSADIKTELTDTIMLCGYNPKTQKAFMLSVPRDTFVGNNPDTAGGFDKINAKYQKSAQKTKETVELITGVKIDYFLVVRNISISNIFECIGDIDFDVPIDMDYDDPTQDLHIHLKKGYQTLNADQVEQLLRFRHNNNGTSYPSSYGDNDYGRMKTQRAFIAAVIDQLGGLGSVGKLKDVAAMVYTNLQTDMSGYTVLDYVPWGLKFSTSNLRSEQLPGQSAMLNELWFYNHSKTKTKALMDELMIYLELEDDIIDSHYKYAKDIKGVKPTDEYVADTSGIKDIVVKSQEKVKDVDPEKCTHNFVALENREVCTGEGYSKSKCTICGTEKTETTSAKGHNYSNGKCTRCGTTDPNYKPTTNTVSNTVVDNKPTANTNTSSKPENTTPEQPSHTHSYTEVVSTTSATCTSSGTVVKKCSCGDTKTETTSSATGHSFNGTECTVCHIADPSYVAPTDPVTPSEPEPPTTPETPPGTEEPTV